MRASREKLGAASAFAEAPLGEIAARGVPRGTPAKTLQPLRAAGAQGIVAEQVAGSFRAYLSAAAFMFASPASKSLPIIWSMLTNTPISLLM